MTKLMSVMPDHPGHRFSTCQPLNTAHWEADPAWDAGSNYQLAMPLFCFFLSSDMHDSSILRLTLARPTFNSISKPGTVSTLPFINHSYNADHFNIKRTYAETPHG